jgi:4-amino-4-deoxy-L-arabinose transferase-like glycosyltransferase
MAEQVLDQGLSDYNIVVSGEEFASKGRPLPDYFFQPLFNPPPVFTFLAALSMKAFGKGIITAEPVSLLMSVLMIPLIYLLETLVYDRRVRILSAFFLRASPA